MMYSCENCVKPFFPLVRSPSVMGILVADRAFLGEIGSLDAGMEVYGGENVELGIRVRFIKLSVAVTMWL